ncbi:unnamed protein product [Candidula unifasciata]|uniref:Major facilitator superfamily (MFS) profile domain-containing protein n=1 Tax=Candidula unifasciata TaxID=100452 RepID=A0A8S4A5F8_9EUPU|nr:unnamed protein product [Candidula unifasciata]
MALAEEKDDDVKSSAKQNTGGCLKSLDWLTKKLRLLDDGATPPNWKYIGLVYLALFSSASTLTFLLPFLPEMMLTLGYSESNKGTYVGIVASSVFAGRIVGSIFWGWLADRQGRKLVLLITIAFNGIFAGLFGFADNLIMAVVFRFLCGAVNGTVGTAKTILYDISDNSNQALSMSMLSVSWGMGMIVGPTVGGVLASPAVKWPDVFNKDGLFGQYPYLLPSLFPFVSCFVIFFVIFFKFDETFVVKSSKRTKQEFTVLEVEHNDSDNAGKESHHPLLGDTCRKSQSSLLQICQSLHSVHAEAESASFLAMETVKKNAPANKFPPAHGTQSLPDINSSSALLDYSEVSNSLSNVSEKCQPGTDIHIIAENSAQIGSANSLDLSHKEFGITEKSICDDIKNEQNQNNLNELNIDLVNSNIPLIDHNCSVVDNIEMNDKNQKLVDSIEDQKIIDNKHSITDAKSEEESERICTCVDSLCCSGSFRKYSLFKLLRLSDVWATVMMYTVFSMITIAIEDIFPVFASTRKNYGGLGFSTNEIGLALGAIFLPLLLLQVKIYPFLVSKMGIRKVFLFSAMVSLICCQCIPMVRLFNNRVWLWICLLGVQIPYKIATNCCFAGTSLLINNSVRQELAGQVNGLAMMTTAIGRTVAPLLAGLLFSWTVTYGEDIGPPLDISFPFFITGVLFFITIFECLHLNPRLDRQKK